MNFEDLNWNITHSNIGNNLPNFLMLALDGETRPGATIPTSPRATLLVVLGITYNFDLIIIIIIINSIIVIINYIIVLYITYNFDHRSVTECNRKIVTTLKILLRCRCYSD